MVIRKLPGKRAYRLYSKQSHRNLGTFGSRAAAIVHERQVEYFKRVKR